MQRRTLVAAAAAFGLTSTALSAFAAEKGTQYVVLDKPLPNAEGTLIKVFSYDCPFCYKYDVGVDPRVLPRIEKEVGLKFKPIHLETKGTYGRCASVFLAMCMLRDEKAGVSIEDKNSLFKKAKDAIYNAYHRKQERWTAGESAFLKTMTDATGLTGIPAYVVNGKYLIMTKSIRNFDGMVSLVKELAAMK